MLTDLSTLDAATAYRLLASLVCPRPIALVTTVDAAGRPNAAPFSFFNLVGLEPPALMICPADRADGVPKDTVLNIAGNGEFIVHLVDDALAPHMAKCAKALPWGESELAYAGLTGVSWPPYAPPRLAEAKVALACRHERTILVGGNRVVFGLVERLWTADGVLDAAGRLAVPGAWDPVGRMETPGGYCHSHARFNLKFG